MTRTELSYRWHVPTQTLARLEKTEEFEKLIKSKGKNSTVFDDSAIKLFEEEKGIPKDPISYSEVRRMTGKTSADLYYYKGQGVIKGIKLNPRTVLYSKSEIEKWLSDSQ